VYDITSFLSSHRTLVKVNLLNLGLMVPMYSVGVVVVLKRLYPALLPAQLPTKLLGQILSVCPFAACPSDAIFFKQVKQKKWFYLFHNPLI
jgi:hypothetical protein